MQLSEGTGGILSMCPCDEFLEIYKEDVTFRFETPETIDPERTNPNAPFVAAVSDRIGCSDPIIARVLLQGRDILASAIFAKPLDDKAVIRTLHGIKESLIACRKASTSVNTSVDGISSTVETQGLIEDAGGRSLPSVPQVADLDMHATQFLISAKRAIKGICALVPLFVSVERPDSNFDHLGDRLEKSLGTDTASVRLVREHATAVRYLIALRNGQEHPHPGPATRIDNVRIQPDGSVSAPMWYRTGETPRPIHKEMLAAIELLVDVSELMLIFLVDERLDSRWPFVIEKLDAVTINPKMPIKYRLTIDTSRLNLPKTDAGPNPSDAHAV